jgi:hypothetical protein
MDEIPDPPSYEKIQAIGKQVYGTDCFRTTLNNTADHEIYIPSCDDEGYITVPAKGQLIVMRTPEGYRNLKEGE